MMTSIFKSYSELILLPTFQERFEYLKLNGIIGEVTFGYRRILNQNFYLSKEWQRISDFVKIRDNGCDLGIHGRQISGRILVHHMNPLSIEDFLNKSDQLLNPEFLITTCHDTHNAIHYGDANLLWHDPIVRLPNDTIPWK